MYITKQLCKWKVQRSMTNIMNNIMYTDTYFAILHNMGKCWILS